MRRQADEFGTDENPFLRLSAVLHPGPAGCFGGRPILRPWRIRAERFPREPFTRSGTLHGTAQHRPQPSIAAGFRTG